MTIELGDIQDEMDYWSNFLVGFILGANPLFKVMIG